MAETQNLTSPLNLGLGGALDNLTQARQAASQKATEAKTQIAEMEDKALTPIREDVMAYQQKAQTQMEDIGRQRAMPVNLPHETMGDLAQLGSLIAIAAPMLGKAGKQSATVAIQSLTGMMDGYQKGRADQFARAKQEYDLNMKRLDGIMSQVKTELDAYLKAAQTKSESAVSHLAAAKAMLEGGVEGAKLKADSANDVLGVVKEIWKTQQSINAANTRLDKQLAAQKGTRTLMTAPDGKTYMVNNAGEATEVQLPVGSYKTGTKPTGSAADSKLMKKNESVARFVESAIGRPVDPDTALKFTATVDYINKLNELKDASLKLGNVSGISVNLSNTINQFLKSTAEIDPRTGQEYITAESLQAAWEAAQDSKAYTALSDKSKVMAKQELDTAMAYLQSKYGNRAPVAEFRAAQNNLSRKGATPEAYQQIINNEIRASGSKIATLGFSSKDYQALSNQVKNNAAGFDLMMKGSESTGQISVNAPDGQVYYFDSEQAANQFKKAAGIK